MGRSIRYASLSQFGKLIGVTRGAVVYQVKMGKIQTFDRNGKPFIDLMTALPKYLEENPKVTLVKNPSIVNEFVLPIDVQEKIRGIDPNEMSAKQAREQQEIFKAKKLEMEYLQSVGELVPIADVKKDWADIAVLIRKTILNIPDRVSTMISGEYGIDAAKCYNTLDVECRAILEDMANEIGGQA